MKKPSLETFPTLYACVLFFIFLCVCVHMCESRSELVKGRERAFCTSVCFGSGVLQMVEGEEHMNVGEKGRSKGFYFCQEFGHFRMDE